MFIVEVINMFLSPLFITGPASKRIDVKSEMIGLLLPTKVYVDEGYFDNPKFDYRGNG